MEAIPAAGLAPDDVIAKLEKHKPAGNGKLWGGIYHEYEGDLTKLQNEVWGAYNCSNTCTLKCGPRCASSRRRSCE